MAEYIERKTLMKFPIRRDHCDKEHANEHFINGIETVMEYAENLPSADVEPVRHGRWEVVDWVEPDGHGFGLIKTNNAGKCCSNCRNCFKAELLWKDNYCPNCGAKMEGGAENAAD